MKRKEGLSKVTMAWQMGGDEAVSRRMGCLLPGSKGYGKMRNCVEEGNIFDWRSRKRKKKYWTFIANRL